MAERVEVDLDKLGAEGKSGTLIDDIVNIQRRLAEIHGYAQGIVEPGSAAYGDDHYAAKFADGSSGFVVNSNQVIGNTSTLSDSLGQVAAGLTDFRDRTEADVHASSGEFTIIME
ncbi:hypothetical protein ABIA39_008528 [Nocardia sp. GAS34]|uniref:hypothetical protein n=1 Tax=unclassified Nocardia TaxID=2637762 RepID=UPI003D24F7BA